MWNPDPTWQRLSPQGAGRRLWRREVPGRGTWVAKRLVRPQLPGDSPAGLSAADRTAVDPRHVLWWRREADVVADRWAESLPGLRGPSGGRIEEDADGITVWWPLVERAPAADREVVSALGQLASAPAPQAPWACADPLTDRWRGVESAGGWTTIGETPAGEVAGAVWAGRGSLLARLARSPAVTVHGDVVPGNLLGSTSPASSSASVPAALRSEKHVVACDWSATGCGVAGTDLGYFTLSTRSTLEPLLEIYLEAAAQAGAALDHDQVVLAARVQMAFTVLTRADRVLARVAGGEGAWQAKLRHPSVAPVIRALQRAYADFAPILD